MRRQGFALGLFSICGQVLLLREMFSSLHGDELFVGTTLFGWLIAVAVGAFWGGRWKKPIDPRILFLFGVVLIPIMIAGVRLAPLVITDIPGEAIPFGTAALISILAAFPIGFVSGWLFPAITQKIFFPASESIVVVYLFEGLGAFAGGIIITLMAGSVLSTLPLSMVIGAVVIGILYVTRDMRRNIVFVAVILAAVAAVVYFVPALNVYLDSLKHKGYTVLSSFDTPYGHEALIKRDESIVLMTDNGIEAVYPQIETAENNLLVPLIYHPDARRVLYIGRPEFGVSQLAAQLPSIQLDALDPRQALTSKLASILPIRMPVNIIEDDPLAYLSRRSSSAVYDIIIINAGDPDSYRTARFFTSRFLTAAKRWLKADGLLFIPTSYDTDRYVTGAKKQVLSIIYQTLRESFVNVRLWPGNTTHFLASDTRPLDLTYEEIISRIDNRGYPSQYINESYLTDRLDAMKTDRLMTAVSEYSLSNTIIRPILPHYQALFQSMLHPSDRRVLSAVLEYPLWMVLVPALIVAAFMFTVRSRDNRRQFALFLYFTAGLASLSLELISFYLYQTTAGSLYAEIALLIGAFMLGLAVGVWYAHRMDKSPLDQAGLALLLTAALIFLSTYNRVSHDALLPYHALFLFVVAIATGTIFVGATNRYYADLPGADRGVGYGWEILGSSIGALVTMTMCLPVIGLTWMLVSVVGLIILALTGTVISNKGAYFA
jgi:spermidine synthase